MNEPWIMTVKGPHGVKGSSVPMMPLEEQPASLTHSSNHKSSNHNVQGKPHVNGASRSPPKESSLNHHKNDSRDGQIKDSPVMNCLIYFKKLQNNLLAISIMEIVI